MNAHDHKFRTKFHTMSSSATYGTNGVPNSSQDSREQLYAELYAITKLPNGREKLNQKISAIRSDASFTPAERAEFTVLFNSIMKIVDLSAVRPKLGFKYPIPGYSYSPGNTITFHLVTDPDKIVRSLVYSIKRPGDTNTRQISPILDKNVPWLWTATENEIDKATGKEPCIVNVDVIYTDNSRENYLARFYVRPKGSISYNTQNSDGIFSFGNRVSSKILALAANPLGYFVPDTAQAAATQIPVSSLYGMPLFKQKMFSGVPYTTNASQDATIATDGSGIVAMAMVANYYANTETKYYDFYNTQNPTIPDLNGIETYYESKPADIPAIVDFAIRRGAKRTPGTSLSFFDKYAENLGFFKQALYNGQTGQMGDETWQKIVYYLESGRPVIVSGDTVNPFIGTGHFVVLTGLDQNGNILVNNPYSPGDPNINDRLWDGRNYSQAMIKRYTKFACVAYPDSGLMKMENY
jgi:hypothetical protein